MTSAPTHTIRWRVYRGIHLIAAMPGGRFATAEEVATYVRTMPPFAAARLIVRQFPAGGGPVVTTTHAPQEQAA